MPTVICPKCEGVYDVAEEDVGKKCECPCGHRFNIQLEDKQELRPNSLARPVWPNPRPNSLARSVLPNPRPNSLARPVWPNPRQEPRTEPKPEPEPRTEPKPEPEPRTEPASSNRWKASLQLKAVIGIGIICLLAFALSSYMMHNDHKNPFRNSTDSIVKLNKIKDRGGDLDEYMKSVKQRRNRNIEFDQSVQKYFEIYSKVLDYQNNRLKDIVKYEKDVPQIRETRKLVETITSKHDRVKYLLECLPKITSAFNPTNDKDIAESSQKISQMRKSLNSLANNIGFSNSLIGNVFDVVLSPVDSIKFAKLSKQINSEQNKLYDLTGSYIYRQDLAIGEIKAEIEANMSLANLFESLRCKYVLP